jgi:hypothetical protein
MLGTETYAIALCIAGRVSNNYLQLFRGGLVYFMKRRRRNIEKTRKEKKQKEKN